MMINLFDDNAWQSLRPLSFTRPVADLRVGILTIAEKWTKHLNAECGFITLAHLSVKYPSLKEGCLYINGSVCPDESLLEAIVALQTGESLKKEGLLIAFKTDYGTTDVMKTADQLKPKEYNRDFTRIVVPEDIFRNNDIELRKDFALITKGRSSAALSATNTLLGNDIFVEEGGGAECSTFNSLNGPIYIGRNSQVWEGCHIRGSFALCDNSQIKMGAKIYAQTTIGPYSRVGGEINNAVIWGYSSKGHEGYLGNSVLGQWCNIGADSNNSNLKNNYAEVRLWDYATEGFRKTGLQFCGLIMADHSKCGINTMFNTGTVTGVSANVFGPGFPRNFIPDFAWGGAQGFDVYKLDKMFETAEKVYERRNIPFDQTEKDILQAVFDMTENYRHF
ncbi:GlmU family protein [Pedobacter africanus]|uniref:UDP-N-acetylglucosamine diphosphorylase/glucosamine-1-phosphate N-acetyltransferase n=1 Tax=Pedobacter africanus TaxID=151894 RepID=A0A1W2E384_9SPHI|nr:GlmU family protein [Pedobacter africanus]SMD03716.1 UDP-N-acetylglucosamine diphosphorylase/glucosamine-1-phosphate N-acetyltransferase [Pedobacter africanus]